MMKRTVTALALASTTLLGCRDDAVSPMTSSPDRSADIVATVAPGGVIPGQYVVLYRRERVALAAGAAAGGTGMGAQMASASATLTRRKLAEANGVLRQTFGNAVHGFAAQLSDSAAAALRADPDVALVEPDHVMHIAASGVESSAPWGLDRIDQAQLPLDGLYRYGNDGTGTSVYIVDTGINFTHNEFGGRAIAGRDFVTVGGTAADCHGHGTHVAGTVGGTTYGVAKNVRLIAARVLDCSGNGSESGVMAALDWVAQQKSATPATPMVVNMSLGGSPSAGLDSAVERTVAAGVTVVVAAGNSTVDACTASPARAPSAITVAATDASDRFASFSNYGSCVDISAPGVSILSAYIGSTTATATLSGTSMATPHVAGSAALYLSAHPSATPAQVVAALVGNASSAPITGLPASTPARLLDVAFLSSTTPAADRYDARLVNAASGLCTDIWQASQTPGGDAVVWTCNGGTNQLWSMPPAGTTGEVRIYGTLCLDASGGTNQVGSVLKSNTCNGGSNQQWQLTSVGELRGATNLCVGVGAADVGQGRLTLQSCTGAANQRWTGGVTAPAVRYDARLVQASSGLCADVWQASRTAGGEAVVWACNGGVNQTWSLPPSGSAGEIHVYGTLCLDAWGGTNQVGDVLKTYTCTGGANQQWELTSAGELRGTTGLCVDVVPASIGQGHLALQTCNGSGGQRWSAVAGTAVARTTAAAVAPVGSRSMVRVGG